MVRFADGITGIALVALSAFAFGGCTVHLNRPGDKSAIESSLATLVSSATPTPTPTPVSVNFGATLLVEAVYPNNGANWNDYVEGTTDTTCTSLSGGYSACTHGGERKKVTLTGVTSCAGLSLSDSLNAFDWQCSLISGTATFFSTGLKTNAGLDTLVNAASWKNNSITLTGTSTGTSASTPWWSNPVVPLPDNSATSIVQLTAGTYGAGAVFTLATSRATTGYNLNGDKMSIVIFPGQTLTFAGAVDNFNYPGGEVGSPNFSTLILVSQQSFNWIEGNLDGNGTAATLIAPMNTVRFLRVRRTRFRFANRHAICMYDGRSSLWEQLDSDGGGWHGFWLQDSSSNTLDGIIVKNASGDGVLAGGNPSTNNIIRNVVSSFNTGAGVALSTSASNNEISNVVSAHNGVDGITISDSPNSKIYNVTVSNNANNGIAIANGTGSMASGITANNNAVNGVEINGAAGTSLSQITTTNNGSDGLRLNNANTTTTNQIVAANNFVGVEVAGGSSQNDFSQVVAAHSSTGIVLSGTSSSTRFAGVLTVGGNSLNCTNTSSMPDVGLTNNTCTTTGTDGSATYPTSLSSAVLRTNRDLSASFVGKVTTDDGANASDTNGTAAYPGSPSTFDWTTFANTYRGWGSDGAGAAFPSGGQRGRFTTGLGRIWDWRLAVGDTVLTNKSLDGTTANETWVAGATCPSSVHGNATGQIQSSGVRYLLNAIETSDSTGNRNGLCETGDRCIYQPNFGSYIGTGSLSSCVFNDAGGTTQVTGVTMLGYP